MRALQFLFLIMTMLVAVVAPPAEATHYEQTMVFPFKQAAAPPDIFVNNHRVASLLVGSCRGTSCPGYSTPVSINSSWNKVKIVARPALGVTGLVYIWAELRLDETSWPGTWPSTFTAEYAAGGNTYKINFVVQDAPIPYRDAGTAINLATGVTLNLAPPYTGWTIASSSKWFKLPSGNYTQRQRIAKTTGGANWTGVLCGVDEATTGQNTGSQDFLSVRVDSPTLTGTGYCPVVKGSTTHNVPITITR